MGVDVKRTWNYATKSAGASAAPNRRGRPVRAGRGCLPGAPGQGGVRRLTDAQLVAVRRALRGLEKTGKVYRVTRFKRTQWANERTGLWMIIRDMQQTSAVIAETGDEAAFRSLAHKMLPLIRRAKELGIDITSDKPPAPTK